MRCRIDLIAMPWADPGLPSIQLGTLARSLSLARPGLKIRCHSAHLCIAHALWGAACIEKYRERSSWGEHVYFALLAQDHRGANVSELLRVINESLPVKRRSPALDLQTLTTVRSATDTFIAELASSLSSEQLNIIGFTLNYDQVFASLYAVLSLRALLPQHRMLFVFGGSSAAYPHVIERMQMLKIPGLCVIGEGEGKCAALYDICAKAADATPIEALEEQIASSIDGVFRIARPPNLFIRQARWFTSQVALDARTPDPDYDEYFSRLDQLETPLLDDVALTLEGSRGCFAKCDFCNLNYIFEGFRARRAPDVAAMTLRMTKRYRVPRVVFVDNVCDTWALGFSTELTDASIASFMELRSHHPETFWTSLSLAGVAIVQLGIEALASNLLARINKGTTVLQNLRAMKYLQELGIQSQSNLMSHHPRSTLADVAETRRLLEHFTHLPRLAITRFALTIGSPLYETLDPSERALLQLRPALRQHSSLALSTGLQPYEAPSSLVLPAEVEAAWDDLCTWYADAPQGDLLQGTTETASLTQRRAGAEGVIVRDTRCGTPEETMVDGLRAQILELGHAGIRTEGLSVLLGCTSEELSDALAWLRNRSFVVDIEQTVFSTPLRPREELIQRHAQQKASKRETAVNNHSLGADNRQVVTATNIYPSLLPRLQQKAH